MTSEKPPVHELAIFGAGGMGQEILDLVGTLDGSWAVVGLLDDSPDLVGQCILGAPVLGGREWLLERDVSVAVGIGAPAARRRLYLAIDSAGRRISPALVHRSAHVGRGCTLGPGSIVAAGAILTADVSIGRCAIVNAGATVSHNCRLGDFATLAPGVHLAGSTIVEEGADIGIGASVIQGLNIGAWSVVGAGAVVIRSVEPNTTVVGCPAKAISSRPSGWHE